jgi:hypothetical protein
LTWRGSLQHDTFFDIAGFPVACDTICSAGVHVQVQHKTSWGELKETSEWLKPGEPLRVGVTSGASTPDSDVEHVLDRILKIVNPGFQGVEPLAEPAAPPPIQH